MGKRRLAGEGELAGGSDVETAARCLWAVTSQWVWDDLAVDQGWSKQRYQQNLTRLLEAGLLPRATALTE